ncbi:hypothetical protein WJX74_001042 [Apatococcus lobatus]|uniref:Uncharacterized protein n=1 Tax=Apatococcus lobatus TaxID=904363 RepID=A0AAW1QYF3_9CHLO
MISLKACCRVLPCCSREAECLKFRDCSFAARLEAFARLDSSVLEFFKIFHVGSGFMSSSGSEDDFSTSELSPCHLLLSTRRFGHIVKALRSKPAKAPPDHHSRSEGQRRQGSSASSMVSSVTSLSQQGAAAWRAFSNDGQVMQADALSASGLPIHVQGLIPSTSKDARHMPAAKVGTRPLLPHNVHHSPHGFISPGPPAHRKPVAVQKSGGRFESAWAAIQAAQNSPAAEGRAVWQQGSEKKGGQQSRGRKPARVPKVVGKGPGMRENAVFGSPWSSFGSEQELEDMRSQALHMPRASSRLDRGSSTSSTGSSCGAAKRGPGCSPKSRPLQQTAEPWPPPQKQQKTSQSLNSPLTTGQAALQQHQHALGQAVSGSSDVSNDSGKVRYPSPSRSKILGLDVTAWSTTSDSLDECEEQPRRVDRQECLGSMHAAMPPSSTSPDSVTDCRGQCEAHMCLQHSQAGGASATDQGMSSPTNVHPRGHHPGAATANHLKSHHPQDNMGHQASSTSLNEQPSPLDSTIILKQHTAPFQSQNIVSSQRSELESQDRADLRDQPDRPEGCSMKQLDRVVSPLSDPPRPIMERPAENASRESDTTGCFLQEAAEAEGEADEFLDSLDTCNGLLAQAAAAQTNSSVASDPRESYSGSSDATRAVPASDVKQQATERGSSASPSEAVMDPDADAKTSADIFASETRDEQVADLSGGSSKTDIAGVSGASASPETLLHPSQQHLLQHASESSLPANQVQGKLQPFTDTPLTQDVQAAAPRVGHAGSSNQNQVDDQASNTKPQVSSTQLSNSHNASPDCDDTVSDAASGHSSTSASVTSVRSDPDSCHEDGLDDVVLQSPRLDKRSGAGDANGLLEKGHHEVPGSATSSALPLQDAARGKPGLAEHHLQDTSQEMPLRLRAASGTLQAYLQGSIPRLSIRTLSHQLWAGRSDATALSQGGGLLATSRSEATSSPAIEPIMNISGSRLVAAREEITSIADNNHPSGSANNPVLEPHAGSGLMLGSTVVLETARSSRQLHDSDYSNKTGLNPLQQVAASQLAHGGDWLQESRAPLDAKTVAAAGSMLAQQEGSERQGQGTGLPSPASPTSSQKDRLPQQTPHTASSLPPVMQYGSETRTIPLQAAPQRDQKGASVHVHPGGHTDSGIAEQWDKMLARVESLQPALLRANSLLMQPQVLSIEVAGVAREESLTPRMARLLTSMLEPDSPVASTQLAAWDAVSSNEPLPDDAILFEDIMASELPQMAGNEAAESSQSEQRLASRCLQPGYTLTELTLAEAPTSSATDMVGGVLAADVAMQQQDNDGAAAQEILGQETAGLPGVGRDPPARSSITAANGIGLVRPSKLSGSRIMRFEAVDNLSHDNVNAAWHLRPGSAHSKKKSRRKSLLRTQSKTGSQRKPGALHSNVIRLQSDADCASPSGSSNWQINAEEPAGQPAGFSLDKSSG